MHRAQDIENTMEKRKEMLVPLVSSEWSAVVVHFLIIMEILLLSSYPRKKAKLQLQGNHFTEVAWICPWVEVCSVNFQFGFNTRWRHLVFRDMNIWFVMLMWKHPGDIVTRPHNKYLKSRIFFYCCTLYNLHLYSLTDMCILAKKCDYH